MIIITGADIHDGQSRSCTSLIIKVTDDTLTYKDYKAAVESNGVVTFTGKIIPTSDDSVIASGCREINNCKRFAMLARNIKLVCLDD